MRTTEQSSPGNEAISRRAAMVGAVGTALGSAFGYERYLQSDEPAFAADLELEADDLLLETGCGIVRNVAVSETSEITLEYSNVTAGALDNQFSITLEADPHVGGRDERGLAGWSEPNDEEPDDLAAVLDEMAGDGSTANPYTVTNDHELQAINEELDAQYELGNDIDATQTGEWNGGDGFDPLVDLDADEAFEGTLDGNGYRICGLTIDRDADGVGLFGVNAGTVEDVGIVHGDIQGGDAVGAVAGVNVGAIGRSYAIESEVEGTELVGGFVGANVREEGEDDQGLIDQSYADCTVSGEGFVGGFVGLNVADIEDAYAKGTIDDGESVVGGFAGSNALGGGEDAGLIEGLLGIVLDLLDGILGIVGIDGDDIAEIGAIDASYSVVDVPDDDNAAGFVAVNSTDPIQICVLIVCITIGGDSGTITDSYWDTDASGHDDGIIEAEGDEGLTGLPTGDMRGTAAQNEMVGFDFADTWDTITDPDDYPQLVETPEPHHSGSTPSDDSTALEALVDDHTIGAEELLTEEDLPHGTTTASFTDLGIDAVPLSEHSEIDGDFGQLEPDTDVTQILTNVEFDLRIDLRDGDEPITTADADPAVATVTVDVS